MRRLNKKENIGITLVALIITIIVLLILAAVTINMVLGENGLFNKAQTSVGKLENAQDRENTALAEYEGKIDNYARDTITIDKDQYQKLLDDVDSMKVEIETLKNANTYSTTEQIVGTYTNGKPLYKVTITGTSSSSNNSFVTIWNGGANVIVIKAEGWVTATNGVRCPICYDDSGGSGMTYHFSGAANALTVQTKGSLFASCPIEATVWYIKKTD